MGLIGEILHESGDQQAKTGECGQGAWSFKGRKSGVSRTCLPRGQGRAPQTAHQGNGREIRRHRHTCLQRSYKSAVRTYF